MIWPYRNCSHSSLGHVPVEETGYAAGHREVAGRVRVHKEAVVKEGDHKAVLQGKLRVEDVGDPSRSDAGDVVGSKAGMAVAVGGRAEAGGAGVAAIGTGEVVDSPPMGEEVPAEVVLEVDNTLE